MRLNQSALLFSVYLALLFGCSSIQEKKQKADNKIETYTSSKESGLSKEKYNSHLAFITTTKSKKKKLYQLIVSDADSTNPKTIVSSSEPIMSPAWSPDGKKIAYVSFENKHNEIYIQTLNSGKRTKIAFFKGISGTPSFSPDGSQLALTLSKDGNPNIYVLNITNQSLKKVTKINSIAIEPTWSPDGSTIVYTSDENGTPQLYKVPSRGGKSSRLTFQGKYNARAKFSPDGKKIAMVHANKMGYRIAILDLASSTITPLTVGKKDESPSFSPNGEMILYVSQKANQNVLSTVSVDGKTQQDLSYNKNDSIREPTWSP